MARAADKKIASKNPKSFIRFYFGVQDIKKPHNNAVLPLRNNIQGPPPQSVPIPKRFKNQ